MTLLRYLDVAVLAIALPIFLLAGLPLLGWVTAAGVWLAWRGIGELLERRAAASDDTRTRVGLLAGGMIGRGWLLAAVIFLVGLADNDIGLSAAVLAVAVFTVHFSVRMILRPFERGELRTP